MHTPKQTAPKLGALPRYQSGGLIGKIKGIFSSGPEETMTQKFARQDAERAAKAAKSAPASSTPAPTAAPATPSSAIGSYAADSALKEREAKAMKAAGLKKGGAVRGPGTGTSDDVPIMASNGEFMIKASAVRKLGLPLLNAINEVGDSKKEEADDSMEDKMSEMGMKKGGAVRCMASGGAVRKEMMTGIPHMEAAGSVDEAQRRAQMLAQIPTGGYNPAPPAQPANWATDTETGRNVSNTLMALPGASPVIGGIRALAGASRVGSMLGAVGSGAATGAGKIAPYAVPAAGLGALSAVSSPAASPVQSPAVPQAATNLALPTQAPATQAAPATAPTPGQVTRDGNSYSGTNVSGPVSFVDKAGGALPARGGFMSGTGDGSFKYGGGADGGEALYAARSAALERGDIEGVRATYGGNFGGKTKADYATDPIQNTIRNLANGPMTAKRAAAMAQLQGGLGATIAGQGQANSSAAASQLARDKFGVDAKSAGIDQEVKSNMLAAQKIMADPKATPEQKAMAEENYRAWQGKYAKEAAPDKYNHGQIGTGPDGTPVFGTYNERTGLPPQGQNPAATNASQSPTTKAQYDALPKGAKYTHPDGTTRTKG